MIDTQSQGPQSGPAFPNTYINSAGTETVTKSGIILPATGSLRAWVKLRGEPAQIFVETPKEFIERWEAFRLDESKPYTVFHVYEYGQAVYFMRQALSELCYVQITYKTAPPRDTAGSYWLNQCVCEFCEAKREPAR
jgi:hypothetical protein